VTLRAPNDALGLTANVAINDPALVMATSLTAIPAPAATVVAPGTKLAPRSVTVRVTPGGASSGSMLISVGDGTSTVNVCVPLVPPSVATVTVRFPDAALGSIVKVAVSAVAVATTTSLTDTPPPLTLTEVAPATNLVPVIATLTEVPCAPLAGTRLTSVGAGGLTANV
jgi:hypothetical protein